jgi:hypothetical protein
MTIAKDAKLRRAMRNKARRNGDPMGLLDNNQGGTVDNLLSTYQRASKRNTLMQALDYSPEAKRLRKQLQNHWYNRTERVDDWACEGKPTTKGKEKRVGKSIPLI